LDTTAPLETRVKDLFNRLTPEERISLLTGTDFTTTPIPRLGIKGMQMADAGQGVRGGSLGTQGPATLFPGGVTMAATWNRDLARQIGAAIGQEAKNKGVGVQVELGPAINIHRSPLNGRNGEYFSEDPYLSGQLAASYIIGMQSTGVGACVKHFACNNEEVDRGYVNVIVDERTLREIYLPAFETAIKVGHPWTLMSSYNEVNGYHSSANRYLLTNILRSDWGWDGMVMSDWGGVHETAGTVNAGNDLEMPGPGWHSVDRIEMGLDDGSIAENLVDDSVRRVLRTLIRTGMVNPPNVLDHSQVDSEAHRKLAYTAASEGIVLLKNERSILPIDLSKVKSIALIGPAVKNWQMAGYGSPYVTPSHSISAYDGIVHRAGTAATITYTAGITGLEGVTIPPSAFTLPDGSGAGLHADYFLNEELEDTPAVSRTDPQVDFNWDDGRIRPVGIPHDDFSVCWTGNVAAPASGAYRFGVDADDGCRLYVNGKLLIDNWVPWGNGVLFGSINLEAGRTYTLKLEYYQAEGHGYTHLAWVIPHEKISFTAAVAAAQQADVAVVFVNSGGEGEGADRGSMVLPGVQNDLIAAVAAANKNTIVVLNNGGPVLLKPWLDTVPGLVEAGFPGEAGGTALAAILCGDVDPSGKLTDTVGAAREDYPDYGNFPGMNGVVHYAEGIYVGYRHFDKASIEPIYPFGYGLSYTTFKYSNIKLSKTNWDGKGSVVATLDITNTGKRPGSEVAELYVRPIQPKIDRPIRELKGFAKLSLDSGQTKTASFSLTGRDLCYCDVPGKQWKADAGQYIVDIGASSRDIRQSAPITLTHDFTEAIPGMGLKDPNAPAPSLATGKPATASSVMHDNTPNYAVDGDNTSRWESAFADP
jgi:beta-glucosidase